MRLSRLPLEASLRFPQREPLVISRLRRRLATGQGESVALGESNAVLIADAIGSLYVFSAPHDSLEHFPFDASAASLVAHEAGGKVEEFRYGEAGDNAIERDDGGILDARAGDVAFARLPLPLRGGKGLLPDTLSI